MIVLITYGDLVLMLEARSIILDNLVYRTEFGGGKMASPRDDAGEHKRVTSTHRSVLRLVELYMRLVWLREASLHLTQSLSKCSNKILLPHIWSGCITPPTDPDQAFGGAGAELPLARRQHATQEMTEGSEPEAFKRRMRWARTHDKQPTVRCASVASALNTTSFTLTSV